MASDTAAPHEHEWRDTGFATVEDCECGATRSGDFITEPATAAQRCPCSKRTLEDQAGRVVWRSIDKGEWCGNQAQPWTTAGGQQREDGWCEDCITKVCQWCRHD